MTAKIDANTFADERQPRFRPYSTSDVWRRVKPGIEINGQLTSRYIAPVIQEYVDMTTGEIINVSKLDHWLKEEGIDKAEVWPVIYASERTLQRQTILSSLRPEVRDLAFFVLAFRDKRRGITPGIDQLVEWYARLHDLRPSNVRRNVPRLEAAGVIDGSSLLGPLFQIAGTRATVRDHRGEDCVASCTFLKMMIRKLAKASNQTAVKLRQAA